VIRPGIRRLFRLGLGRREDVERETDEEIRAHLERRAEELEGRGLSPEEARAEARRRFGDPEVARAHLLRAASRRERRIRLRDRLDSLRRDVRHAWRTAAGEPGLTGVVVLVIALGVGANAAMFGVLDRLLLRGPEQVTAPRSLVRFSYSATVPGEGTYADNSFGYVTYTTLRDHSRGLSGVAAYSESHGVLGQGLDAAPIRVGSATADFFPLLGTVPSLGRFFDAEEDRPGSARRVAVLGHALWESRFGADPAIVGRTVRIDGGSYTVVGVARAGFTGVELGRVDAWLPMSLRQHSPNWATTWHAQWLRVVARLAPGVMRERASAEATRAFRAAYTGGEEAVAHAELHADPLSYDDSGRESMQVTVARWLIGVALVVLLVAVANVTNLLLARALRRRREVSLRLALGISRGRLVRLLVGESLLLAVLGGAAALAVVPVVGGIVRRTLLPGVEWAGGTLDGRVLAFAGLLTLVTGLATGLAPALRAGRQDVTASLRSGIREQGHAASRLRSWLAVAQSALSVLLLVGAGLFVRSLQRARGVDLGFEPDRVLVVSPDWSEPGPAAAPTPEEADRRRARREAFFAAALAKARRLPGVDRAAVTVGTPFRSWFTVRLRVGGMDSVPILPGGGPYIQAVSPDYFATMGLSLLKGRAFGPGDHRGSEPVAVVSRTMASTLWPGGDAIGRCLLIGRAERLPCARVVGVVEDSHRYALHEKTSMQYYIPLGQEHGFGGARLVVRPRGDPEAQIAALRKALASLDGTVLYLQIRTLENAIDPQYRPWRLGATLMGAFGILALVIATVGLYSLLAYMVADRRHEVGIRMALGAGRGDILRLIIGRGIGLVLSGLAVGGLLAAVLGPRLKRLLFEVSPLDPLTFATSAGALFAVAVLACAIPARRATGVDPARVLRSD
jgi:predicted permease